MLFVMENNNVISACEEVVVEILHRLLEKLLIRCKCVCKAWNWLINDVCIPRYSINPPLSCLNLRAVSLPRIVGEDNARKWYYYIDSREKCGSSKFILNTKGLPFRHCLPWIFSQQVAGYLSLRVQQLDVRCETKTKDNVFVTVVASIQYRALTEKASNAFYKLSNTREQIQSYVFDVIRASVPKMNLDDVFEQKNDIAKAMKNELEKAMSTYGYEIVQMLIVDIEPDVMVKSEMNETNADCRSGGLISADLQRFMVIRSDPWSKMQV